MSPVLGQTQLAELSWLLNAAIQHLGISSTVSLLKWCPAGVICVTELELLTELLTELELVLSITVSLHVYRVSVEVVPSRSYMDVN